MKMVLQKFIADNTHHSRRSAEALIKNSKVKVNGELAVLGMRVDETDIVLVEGGKVEIKQKKYYIILNKPVGYTCTSRKFKEELNVFDLVKTEENIESLLHVVGRLDKNSRGLALLTNDGALTQKLTHPSFEHEKEYEVEIKNQKLHLNRKEIQRIIENFKKGVDIGCEDGIVRAKDVEYIGDNKFRVILTEGKKRQIRRMFESVGWGVVDLLRTRIGKLRLDELKEGKWRFLKEAEIKNFKF